MKAKRVFSILGVLILLVAAVAVVWYKDREIVEEHVEPDLPTLDVPDPDFEEE